MNTYAQLGPPIPISLVDTKAVRIHSCAVMADLNMARQAVVTFSISPRNTDDRKSFLLLTLDPRSQEIMRCVRLQGGEQCDLPLQFVPGICVDLARSMVSRVFAPT